MKRLFKQRRSQSGGWWTLTIVTVLLCLLAGEFAGRLLSPEASLWRYPNYIVQVSARDPDHQSQMRFDAALGHEPVPGFKGELKGKPISFSADGTRNHNLGQNPGRPAPLGPPVLTLGDSFTEGYMVGDDETWPAALERLTGRRVLNAGVRAYGIDQAVLRGERLASKLKPHTIVLAFIADDIERAGLKVRDNNNKPYFALDGESGLALHNVPVPTNRDRVSSWRQVAGYSYLADFVMRRLRLTGLWYGTSVEAHDDALEVSCRLMFRFAQLAKNVGSQALVVALPQDMEWTHPKVAETNRRIARTVLDCAAKAGLPTLDTTPGFAAENVAKDVPGYYLNRHFSARGNALAARLIARALEAQAK
jgi:lysophospholipase L1-like esterase